MEHIQNFKIILITGPKHTGKSSVGYITSQLKNGIFIDLDELVECQTGKSPRALYKEGPHIFRMAETAALKSLFDTPEDVCSLFNDKPDDRGVQAASIKQCYSINTETSTEVKNRRLFIVAAGGGLIDNEDAIALLKNSVDINTQSTIHNKAEIFIIYLDVSADTAWNRILRSAQQSGELPAFLQTADPITTHRTIHLRRSQAYRELAHFIIHGENKPADCIAQEIANLDIFQ
ncbi:MAG: shikimate kinase [Treponema sp.]|jgi:shikimate kinase|nr:shikimate kinase [Treponema sp.]